MIFTLFDIILLSILAISSLLGMYSGFLRLSINMIAFIASITTAYFLYPLTKELLGEYIVSSLILAISSGALSYVVSLIIFSILSSKTCALMQSISGGMIDRLLGLIGGFVRGSIICLLIFLSITVFTSGSYVGANSPEEAIQNIDNEKYPIWLKTSITTKYFDMLISHIAQTLKPTKLS